MADMILGVFLDRANADTAVSRIKEAGYDAKEISILMKEGVVTAEADESGASVVGGAVTGATTGGVIGGLAGLLIGIGAIALPGIGGILVGGPIAAALGVTGAAATTVSGAVTGALAGGLVGALVGFGVPEEEARAYEEQIKQGAILLAIPVRAGREDEARAVLEESGADQIRTIHAK